MSRFKNFIDYVVKGKRVDEPEQKTAATGTNKRQRAFIAGFAGGVISSDHRRESAHFTSWSYVAIHRIALQCAQCKVSVKKQQKDGDKPLRIKALNPDGTAESADHIHDHPILDLLKTPNMFDSGSIFIYKLAQQLMLTGGFAIWKVMNQLDKPMELWNIPRAWLSPFPPAPAYPYGAYRVDQVQSAMFQSYSFQMAAQRTIDRREFIEDGFPHPTMAGDYQSPLAAFSREIDISEETEKATMTGMKNAVKPSVFIKLDQGDSISEEEKDVLRREIETYKSGSDNAGAVFIAQGVNDIQFKPAGVSELDYVNSRAQNQKNVMGLFGCSPFIAGMEEDATYSGGAAKARAFGKFTVAPILKLIAGALTRDFQKYYGKDIVIELDPAEYDDPQMNLSRAQAMAQGMSPQAKESVTLNEWRGTLGLPPVDGGDELQQPQPPPGMPGMPGQMPPGADPNAPPQSDLPPDLQQALGGLDPMAGDDTTTGETLPPGMGVNG